MTNRKPQDLEAFEAGAQEMLVGYRRGCPPARMLLAARAEALPEEQQAAISAHLETCASCRTLRADLECVPEPPAATPLEVRRILARVRREYESGSSGREIRWRAVSWWAAVTAGLAVCAGLVIWQIRGSGPPALPAGSPPVVRLPVPATQAPEALKLEKPAVKMTLAILTWRGKEEEKPQFLQDIAPALTLYRADRFAEAADQLEALSAKYKESVEVFFYLGICRLFLGQSPAASEALQRAARFADDSFSADISWYLSLSYQRSGHLSEARAQLSALCGAQSPYRDRACDALHKLGGATAAPGAGQSPLRR